MVAALVTLALAAAALTAAAALVAASSARAALADLRAERRRERRERLEEAVGEVHRAALAYERAMGAGADAAQAAERYGEACARLSAALAGGPPPGAAGEHLPVLLDPTRPERVVRSRAAEKVLAEIARLRAAEGAPAQPVPWGVALPAALARIRSAARLARLGRPGPPAAGGPRSPAPPG